MEAQRTGHLAERIRVVLFDVGGVLVELQGVETILGWRNFDITADELWRLWLHSPSVRAFETGKLDAQTFARRMVAELQIGVAPQRFLELFAAFPVGLYPDTLQMLARIPTRYSCALLSNSNSLHWSRIVDDMGLGKAIEHHFVSHLTGKIKPDAEAFQHVTESLGCEPRQVLFFDDNALNVQAAQRAGMHALLARGAKDVETLLIDAGVIASS